MIEIYIKSNSKSNSGGRDPKGEPKGKEAGLIRASKLSGKRTTGIWTSGETSTGGAPKGQVCGGSR